MSTSEPLCKHGNLPGTCLICDKDFIETLTAPADSTGDELDDILYEYAVHRYPHGERNAVAKRRINALIAREQVRELKNWVNKYQKAVDIMAIAGGQDSYVRKALMEVIKNFKARIAELEGEIKDKEET